jgi:hypothetical protein
MTDFKEIQKTLDRAALSIQLPKVPTMPDFRMAEMPEIKIPPNPLIVAAEANRASEFHKRLTKWLADFDAALDEAHEVGVRLVNFGQSVVFHLTDVGYWNPSLMSFSGETDAGEPVQLIQHVSQISILLMKLPRKDPSTPKRPLGFTVEDVHDGLG